MGLLCQGIGPHEPVLRPVALPENVGVLFPVLDESCREILGPFDTVEDDWVCRGLKTCQIILGKLMCRKAVLYMGILLEKQLENILYDYQCNAGTEQLL